HDVPFREHTERTVTERTDGDQAEQGERSERKQADAEKLSTLTTADHADDPLQSDTVLIEDQHDVVTVLASTECNVLMTADGLEAPAALRFCERASRRRVARECECSGEPVIAAQLGAELTHIPCNATGAHRIIEREHTRTTRAQQHHILAPPDQALRHGARIQECTDKARRAAAGREQCARAVRRRHDERTTLDALPRELERRVAQVESGDRLAAALAAEEYRVAPDPFRAADRVIDIRNGNDGARTVHERLDDRARGAQHIDHYHHTPAGRLHLGRRECHVEFHAALAVRSLMRRSTSFVSSRPATTSSSRSRSSRNGIVV